MIRFYCRVRKCQFYKKPQITDKEFARKHLANHSKNELNEVAGELSFEAPYKYSIHIVINYILSKSMGVVY